MPILAKFGLSSNACEKAADYLVSLHRYKVQGLLKNQENVVKKCEQVEKSCITTLSDNIPRFAVRVM